MDEYTADAFANRDEPLPVIALGNTNDLSDVAEDSDNGTHHERKRDRLKKHTTTFKENFLKGHGASESKNGPSMQDRLLEKYISTFFEPWISC
jgi:hypothetical protein